MSVDSKVVLVIIALAHLTVAGIATHGAIVLASEGKDGWGWMIFLAIALGCSGVSIKGK